MSKNIFEGAKFGDIYRTRKGEKVIFIEQNRLGMVTLIAKPMNCVYSERTVHADGKLGVDIELDDDVITEKL